MKRITVGLLVFISGLSNCVTTYMEGQSTSPRIVRNSLIQINATPKIISAELQTALIEGKATTTYLFGMKTGGIDTVVFSDINSEGYNSIERAAIADAIEKSKADSFQVIKVITEKKSYLISSTVTSKVIGHPIKFKFQ